MVVVYAEVRRQFKSRGMQGETQRACLVRLSKYEKRIESFYFYEEGKTLVEISTRFLFLKMVCTSITTEGATLFVPCTLLPF
jgi:hypothetical protein